LEEAADRIRESGRSVIFCGAREQPRAVMEQAGFPDHIGRENFCPHVDAALERAADIRSADR
jgi:SulP family sulfate permease